MGLALAGTRVRAICANNKGKNQLFHAICGHKSGHLVGPHCLSQSPEWRFIVIANMKIRRGI